MPILPAFARTTAACRVVAHGLHEARLSAIDRLRDVPGPPGSPPLPPRFLRHCDEHTVVAMHAVLAAIASLPEPRPSLSGHGVVAAPCQAGRLSTARALVQMKTDGPVAISPHIVPQCSLHSIAGAVSVGLGMHGPHLGAGGGPGALAEGLVAATSLLRAAAGLPGVWLVATEWDLEPALDGSAMVANDPWCRALAVLLDPSSDGDLQLDVRADRAMRPGRTGGGRTSALPAFTRALALCRVGGALVSWTLPCPWPLEVRLCRRTGMASGSPAQREAA
jgi:hypothetical protein